MFAKILLPVTIITAYFFAFNAQARPGGKSHTGFRGNRNTRPVKGLFSAGRHEQNESKAVEIQFLTPADKMAFDFFFNLDDGNGSGDLAGFLTYVSSGGATAYEISTSDEFRMTIGSNSRSVAFCTNIRSIIERIALSESREQAQIDINVSTLEVKHDKKSGRIHVDIAKTVSQTWSMEALSELRPEMLDVLEACMGAYQEREDFRSDLAVIRRLHASVLASSQEQ